MRIIKDYIFYFGGSFIPAIINLVTIPLYLQAISLEEFGYYSIFLVFTNFFTILMTGQVASGILKYYHSKPLKIYEKEEWRSRYCSSLFWITLVASTLLAVILLLLGQSVHILVQEIDLDIFIILWPLAITYSWIFGIKSFFEHICKSQRRTANVMSANVVMALVNLAVTFYFFMHGNLTLESIFKINIASLVVSMVILIFSNIKLISFKTTSFKHLKPSLKYSIGLFPHLISKFILNNIDKILLLKLLSAELLAVYFILLKVVNLFERIVAVNYKTLNPVLLSLDNKDLSAQFKTSFDVTTFSTYLFYIGSAIALPAVTLYLSEVAYKYWELGLAMLFVPVFLNIRSFFIIRLHAGEKTHMVSLISIFLMVFTIVIYYILIPHYALAGVAMAQIFIHTLALFAYYLLNKNINMETKLTNNVKIHLISIFMIITFAVLWVQSFMLGGAIGLVTGASITFYMYKNTAARTILHKFLRIANDDKIKNTN